MHPEIDAGSPHAVQGLLRLIECIYAAASAEAPWDRPVEEICRLGRFDAGALVAVERRDGRRRILGAYSHAPFAPGAPAILPPNPLLSDGVLASAPGAIWRDHEVMLPEVLGASAFWTDWMVPNRFAHWAAMIVGRRDGQVVCLEVYARAGRPALAPEARHLLTRLAPHLTRAWQLGEAIRMRSEPPAPAEPARSDDDELTEVARLRADFGLTRAEARLALALAGGTSLAAVAKLFGRKLTTVRSQLQQVFAKTGTARQAELVAMLLGRGDRRGPEPAPRLHEAGLRPVNVESLVRRPHPPRPAAH